MRASVAVVALLAVACAPAALAQKHPFGAADLHRLQDVATPDLSPDGQWVAYAVTRHDMARDLAVTDLWRARFDGSRSEQLTFAQDEANSLPQWSPDGRWIAFLSDRDSDDDTTQLWLMPVGGGEARKLTTLKGGVSDYAWSPDGKQFALIASDDPDAPAIPAAASAGDDKAGATPGDKDAKPAETPKPIVLDRFQFRDDTTGYLTHQRAHLYAFDIATQRAVLLTPGDHDEWAPAWSPDGASIVYASKRGDDPDRSLDSNLYLVAPRAGSAERRLTAYTGTDMGPEWESRPAWSPDGRQVAYVRGGDAHWIYYAPWQLAVVDVATGRERLVAPIDRCMTKPHWSADGRALYALVEESRATWLSRIGVADGKVEHLTQGPRFDVDFAVRGDRIALLGTDDTHPAEVFALDHGLRRLSHQNDAVLADVQLQPAEDIRITSKDGTAVDGFLMKPVGYVAGKRYPTVLDIHGGPVYQFSHEFMERWQWFAAHGYAVVAANPRGSSGRGFDFAKAIYADWGHVDGEDVLAAVDHAVALGVADPKRLAVNGWSYGSILTDQVIVQDTRFGAATSGAGSGNFLGLYGVDEYVREYEAELGKPWEHPDAYLRLSAPLLHADRIRTPTLFACAELDFNVPCEGALQMYQALRSTGVPTQLVIYPGEHHGLSVPSYIEDRLQRYTDWYDRFLVPKGAAP